MLVGVLALQGGFSAHAKMLLGLGHRVREVRSPADLSELEGLVLPGGESTVQRALIDETQLQEPLARFHSEGRPILATCAGAILAADFGWLDMAVRRNAWGRQVKSFEAVSDEGTELPAFPLMFIRAPRITAVGATTEVLSTFEREPVLVRSASVFAATFHPELTEDVRVHRAVFWDPSANSPDAGN